MNHKRFLSHPGRLDLSQTPFLARFLCLELFGEHIRVRCSQMITCYNRARSKPRNRTPHKEVPSGLKNNASKYRQTPRTKRPKGQDTETDIDARDSPLEGAFVAVLRSLRRIKQARQRFSSGADPSAKLLATVAKNASVLHTCHIGCNAPLGKRTASSDRDSLDLSRTSISQTERDRCASPEKRETLTSCIYARAHAKDRRAPHLCPRYLPREQRDAATHQPTASPDQKPASGVSRKST